MAYQLHTSQAVLSQTQNGFSGPDQKNEKNASDPSQNWPPGGHGEKRL